MEEVAGARFSGDYFGGNFPFQFFLLLFRREERLVPFDGSCEIVIEVKELFYGRGNDLRMMGKVIVERRGAAALGANDDKTGEEPLFGGQVSDPDVRNGQGPFRPSGQIRPNFFFDGLGHYYFINA